MGNIVAIVGRPNVGKSTLFNRLTQTRHAIVSDEAGTTRDRQYGKSDWTGREFSVIDTGGWVVNSDDIFEEEIRKQVTLATEEADVILFLVDVRNGLTDLDEAVANILRRTKKPVVLVANKADTNEWIYSAAEFYALGLGDPYCISAATGSGTGELLDLIVSKFPKTADDETDENIPRFAVVGRPNAGKSSLINKKLQLIQKLEPPCSEETDLFDAALKVGPSRIIVKRPLKSECLAGREPSYTLKGKAIRYDCYVLYKLPLTEESPMRCGLINFPGNGRSIVLQS